MYKVLCQQVFISLGHISRYGTTGSCSSSGFNILGIAHFFSQRGCILLLVPSGFYEGVPCPGQHLLLSVFLCSHSSGFEVVPYCGFICLSLMISDIGHHFMWLSAFCLY